MHKTSAYYYETCLYYVKSHLSSNVHMCVTGKKNEVVLKVPDSEQDHGKWWFSQRNAQGEVMLTLHSPADALVGLYSMSVVLLSADGHILEKTQPKTFYLLFNPWCKGEYSKALFT